MRIMKLLAAAAALALLAGPALAQAPEKPKIVIGATIHTAGTRKLRSRSGSVRRSIITATATIRNA